MTQWANVYGDDQISSSCLIFHHYNLSIIMSLMNFVNSEECFYFTSGSDSHQKPLGVGRTEIVTTTFIRDSETLKGEATSS